MAVFFRGLTVYRQKCLAGIIDSCGMNQYTVHVSLREGAKSYYYEIVHEVYGPGYVFFHYGRRPSRQANLTTVSEV